MKMFRTLMVLALLVCLVPVVSVLLASAIATASGCQLDEGSVHPCLVLGHDAGMLLSIMGVAGWYAILTLPAAARLAALWICVEAVRWFRRRGASSPAN